MANVEKLPSGRYRGRYIDADGKKRAVAGTFGRKSDAMDAAVEEQAKARRKAAARKGTLSARTTWGEWWEVVAEDRHFESDAGRTEQQLVRAYVLPRWHDVPLNKIAQRNVQKWVHQLTDGKAPVEMVSPRFVQRPLSPGYVQRIYSPFSVSITKAVDEEVLDASPCAGVKLPKRVKKPKPYMVPDDTAELELREDYQDAVDFMHETGLRPNEMTGLHSHRIDRKRRVLIVADVYVFRAKKIRSSPKDGDSREVPLTARALEIVDRRLEDRDLREPCGLVHMRGERCSHPLVFITELGRPLNRDTLNYHLRRAAVDANVEARSGYAIRRGTATRAAEAGLDVFTMAEIFGWADIKMAQEYVQQTSTAHARWRAAMGEKLGLSVVDDGVGSRGPGRGTDSDNQAVPDTTKEGGKNVS